MGFGEKDHKGEVLFSSPCIIGDVDLDHRLNLFASFLLLKLLFFSTFLYCTLWKDVTMSNLHLRNEELSSTSFQGRAPTQVIQDYSASEICLFSLFIYLINHLFILVWPYGYLFHTLGYNPILLYFFTPIVLAIGCSFS